MRKVNYTITDASRKLIGKIVKKANSTTNLLVV